MHRTWNLPLGIGLFGAAVLLGGGILAYPETRRAPSKVDVSDPIATRPFPSFPDEVPAVAGQRVTAPQDPFATPFAPKPPPAPSAVGGGPRAEGTEEGERPQSGVPAAKVGAPPALPAPTQQVYSTPTPAVINAGTTSNPPLPTTTATSTDAGVGTSSAALTGDAGATAVGDRGTTAVGDASYNPTNTPAIVPMYGGFGTGVGTVGGSPQVPVGGDNSMLNGGTGLGGTGLGGAGGSTGLGGAGSSGGGLVDAGAASDALLTNPGGGGGGSTAVGDTGVVDPAASISAPLLVPMSTTTESFWSSIRGYLRAGDIVVARDSAALGFSERAKTDAPTVTFVVAFDSPTTLHGSLDKLPATVGTVGLSAAGLTDASLAKASDAVHAVGRRFFLSTNVPANGPSLASIATHADVVELVIGGDIPGTAKATAATLGPKMQIFVRLPDIATGAAAAAMSKQIVGTVPTAGVAIPAVANVLTLLTNYRATR